MRILESMTMLTAARNTAADNGQWKARNTFDNIIDVINRAATVDAKKWTEHTKAIIEKVQGGSYPGTHDQTRKLLNRITREALRSQTNTNDSLRLQMRT